MTIPPNPHPEQVEAITRTIDRFVCTRWDQGAKHDLAQEVIASLANRPADDVCDVCNGHGFWETAPGTCNPGGERIPCGKCSNVTITMGGQTWSTNQEASGTNGTTKSEQPR